MSEGIVYVLTNPAMPGMVKIGRTGRQVEARLSDLYSTGVPLPFECEYAARVKDQNERERVWFPICLYFLQNGCNNLDFKS